jgi:hypothetical protein
MPRLTPHAAGSSSSRSSSVSNDPLFSPFGMPSASKEKGDLLSPFRHVTALLGTPKSWGWQQPAPDSWGRQSNASCASRGGAAPSPAGYYGGMGDDGGMSMMG